jgi:cytochrome P450
VRIVRHPAPGVSQWLPLPWGEFGAALRDPIAYFSGAREKYGDIFRMRVGPTVAHVVFHPDQVRRILIEEPRLFVRGWHYRILRRLMGANLVVTDGAEWIRHRHLAQPAFHRSRLPGYLETMHRAIDGMLASWQTRCERGEPLDLNREMSLVTLTIAARTLFGQDVGEDAQEVEPAFRVVEDYLEQRFNHIFTSPPLWVPTPLNRRFKQAYGRINDIVKRLIAQRRHEGGDRGDLLSILLKARDEETGSTLSDDEIRSNCLAFFVAGHETTATALAWNLYALGQRPELRQRLRNELKPVEPPPAASTAEVDYTRMVIEEGLRLYPPVFGVIRSPIRETELSGYTIPRGSPIVISPLLTQRHPDVWPDPLHYNPERFAPSRRDGIPRGAMFPFLAGPHLCIGQEFAMLEMRAILTAIAQRFDWSPTPGPMPKPVASIALRSTHPLTIRLSKLQLE